MKRAGRCRLGYLLKINKMNQHDLAIKLGVSKQIVSRWVNNQTLMSFENAYRVSKILKVSMEELYEWR